MLISAWADQRADASMQKYEIEQRAAQEGWTLSLVRDLAELYRPKLSVKPSFGITHPLAWAEEGQPDQVVSVDVDYPHPHEDVRLPDEFVPYAVDCFRTNLDLAVALERDVSGAEQVYLPTSREPDGGPGLSEDSYGLTGPAALTLDAVAAPITRVTGRQVRYQAETLEEASASRNWAIARGP